MFAHIHFIGFALLVSVAAYDVSTISNMNETFYVLYTNYGTNDIHHCQSSQVISKNSSSWLVSLRAVPPGGKELHCYNTTVKVHNRNGSNESDILAYAIGPGHAVQQREIVYANGNTTCFILKDLNVTAYANYTQCQLILTESTVKLPVPSDCADRYRKLCGDRTSGSFRFGCLDEPKDASCFEIQRSAGVITVQK
uniref:Putative secreted protein n=1 Tax=Amblyomma parvum TaxID=251391 RepID=A0A023FSN1_AMBPA